MDGIKVEILENDDKHFPTLLHSPHTYLHSEFHIESSKKWLNGQFYALVSFSVNQWSKCIIYFYSIRDIQTIISLMVVLSPQQVTANTWESEYLTHISETWLRFGLEEVFKSFFMIFFLPD